MTNKNDILRTEPEKILITEKSLFFTISCMNELFDILKTSYGPLGKTKLFIDPQGKMIITNDGNQILNQIIPSNNIIPIIQKIAKNQSKLVGDGLKTSILLGSEFLRISGVLLQKNINPILMLNEFSEAFSYLELLLERKKLKKDLNAENLIDYMNSVILTKNVNKKLSEMIIDGVFYVKENLKEVDFSFDYLKVLKSDQNLLYKNHFVLESHFYYEELQKSKKDMNLIILDRIFDRKEETNIKDSNYFVKSEKNFIEDILKFINEMKMNNIQILISKRVYLIN